MQQQALAWFDAARRIIRSKKVDIYRLLICTLVAPLLVSISSSAPAFALTVAAGDGYCTQTVSATSGVSVLHVGNSCVVTFAAPSNTTTSLTWTVPSNASTVSVLVVAGGGSGGARHGSGGGAGGLIYQTGVSVTPSANISVTAGKGGDAIAYGSAASNGNSGVDSKFGSYTATGGGYGGQVSAGGNGGSGGGGCCNWAPGSGNTPATTPSQGNNGGNGTRGSSEWNWSGGGGGGAGSVGGSSTSTSSIGGVGDYTTSGYVTGGMGGNGVWNSITGTATCYAAGGGGGVAQSGTSGGAGGKCDSTTVGGSGGRGSATVLSTAGTDGTGSGGGGGGFEGATNGASGRGGSGIVIVRYDLPSLTLDVNGGSGYTGSTSPALNASGSATLPSRSSMTKSGYQFGGWNTAIDGTGTNYAEGATFTPTTATTLYARWYPLITFNGNGYTTESSTLPAPLAITNNTATNSLPIAYGLGKSNYTFGGWNGNETGTGTSYPGSNINLVGLPTPYLRLEASNYDTSTNTWVATNGANVPSSNIKSSSNISKITSASANGSTSTFTAIRGTSAAGITLGNARLSSGYTFCSVARMTALQPTKSTANGGRLFDAIGENWLSGWWSGYQNQFFHNNWMTNNTQSSDTSFHLICDRATNNRWDGAQTGTSTGVTGLSTSLPPLSINNGYFSGGTGAASSFEVSPWEVAEVIIYNSTLGDDQVAQVEAYLKYRYGVTAATSSYSAGTAVSNFQALNPQNLYAQWNSVISYSANNGTSGTAPSSTTISGTQGTLANNSGSLSKSPQIFLGWYSNSDGVNGSFYPVGSTYSNTGNATLYAYYGSALTINGNSSLSSAVGITTKSDTYTITGGYGAYTVRNTLSPFDAGITIDTKTANAFTINVAPTVATGTYYETITVTESTTAVSRVITITVVSPLVWSAANPSAVVSTFGKSTRTRLDVSGGYGTRTALISHMSSPAPRGVTIDTSTIASGYITLITDTGTAPGIYLESITVTDGSKITRTSLVTVTINAPPDIAYSSTTDAPYPYRTNNLVLNVDPSNPSSYSGTGQTLRDISATGKTFTFYNGSDVATNGVFAETAGGVISQDGVNLYAQSTSLPSMDTFTVEAWVNLRALNATNEYRSIVNDMYTTAGDKINFALGTCSTAGEICGEFYDGANWVAYTTFRPLINTWYHLAYVVGGTTGNHIGYLYVNGVLVSTSAATTSNPTTSNRGLRIGRRWDAAQIFNGLIGSVRIYNTALTSTQILQNYANTKARFVSLSSAAPTNSGNASFSMTEGQSATYQIFAETGGTGANTFSLSGSNSTMSLASVGTDQTSLVVSSAITAGAANTVRTYYETLTATDSVTSATAYYITINVNPKILVTATTDTVTTTFGKVAYDTITASYGTGTLSFTRTSSSGSSAITSAITGTQSLLTVAGTLPAGTYYETFTVTDSVSATTLKVITIIVNPAPTLTADNGSTTINTTYTRSATARINFAGGNGTKTFALTFASGNSNWKISIDTSTVASGFVTLKVDTYTVVGTTSVTLTMTDSSNSSASISYTINVNQVPRINGAVNEKSINTSGLIYHLDAANTDSRKTTSSWYDIAGSGTAATFTNAPTFDSSNGGSYSFNGSSNYLTLPALTTAGSPGITGNALTTFTVESWVKFGSVTMGGNATCIFCESWSGSGNLNLALYLSGTGQLHGGYVNSNNWYNDALSSTTLTTGTWYHIAYDVWFDGTVYQTRMYLNGVQVGSNSSSTAPASNGQPFLMGRRWDSTTQLLNGSIGLVRLYNRALSAAEIQQNYTALAPRYGLANYPSSTFITTQGATGSSTSLTATLGTGDKTLAASPVISGVTTDLSVSNAAAFNFASSLQSTDTQTAKTYVETLTATDVSGAAVNHLVYILVNPPIIETATVTSIATTSGIETSTVIYATKGSSDKTFALTGTVPSGITLTSGTNQATLRVLSTINPGSYSVTVTASDTASATTSITISIVVSPPPSLAGSSRLETTQGALFKSSLYAISGGTGTLTMTWTNSPANSNITLTGNSSSGAYLQIGTGSATGTFTSTIRVTDVRGAYSELAVTVVVNAPVTLSGSLSITKTYGTSVTNGYSTNGTGTAPFSFSATPVCAVVKTVSGAVTYEKINGTDGCTWTAPAGVSTVDAFIVGGGGGGGPDGGAGGGGGSINTLSAVAIPANRQLSVQVGAGGLGGYWAGDAATNGGTTSISNGTTTYTAPGGTAGGGCGSSAAAGGVTGSGGSALAGGNGGYGSTGTGCGNGNGAAGSNGPSSSFTGSSITYGGGGGGGPYPSGLASVGLNAGGAGGGGTSTQASGQSAYGLPTYFRALAGTPSNATAKEAFTTGTCGAVTGNIGYSTDSEFPCSQKDNFQGYATGYFVAPYTGSITFYLTSDDSSDLVINVNGTNQELQLSGCCTTVSATWANFVAGQAYPINVYFTEITGSASWKLDYAYGAVTQTTIPLSQFRSGSFGLATYFRANNSTSALSKNTFTSGTCAQVLNNINYSTDSDFPCDGKDNFQGYATGYFVSPVTGDITFTLTSDDSSDLVLNVNGNNNEIQQSIGSTTVTWSGFVKGQFYPISMYFTEITGVATWKLEYAYSGQTKIIVPTTYLRSNADFVAPTAGTNGLGGGGGAGSAGLYKISGARGGSGTAIIKYTTPSDTATETIITAYVNQESPSGLLTLNVPAYVQVGTYTETITVRDAANSAPYSASVTITINKATPTTTLSLPGGVTTAQYGTPVILSAAASTPGNIAFKKSGTAISGCSSVATTNGVATCTWTPTAVESTTITALLSPTDSIDYNISNETASALSITVGKADTLTITANSPSSITYSSPMTLPANGFTTTGLKSIDTITAVSYSYSGTQGSTCAWGGTCSVGDIGPAGGIVFYVSATRIDAANGVSVGGLYLEAAPAPYSTTIYNWCEGGANPYTTQINANGTAVGTGAGNTAIMLSNCSGGAARAALAYRVNGIGDWFLPSTDELAAMSTYKTQIGLDTNSLYWGSTESSNWVAASLVTSNGGVGGQNKGQATPIWPIHAFSPGGTTATPVDAGTYTITPSSPVFSSGAASNYVSINYVAGSLTINRAPRSSWTATYNSGTNATRYGVGKTETATVTYPGDGVKAFTTSSNTCSVDGSTGTLTTLGVGSCAIQVVLPQTKNWFSDTKTVTVTINRGLRTATIAPRLSTIKYGDTTTVTTTISPALDSATVTYSNNGSLGCAVDNVTGQITGIKALTACAVKVFFDQTTLYESATATASVTVNKATAPVVTTDTITAVAYTGATAIVAPTYKVTGILARDISQILPLADVSSTAAINAIPASTYTSVTSFRYFATNPTSYDSSTAPTLGGTYAVSAQNLTLLSGLDIGNYETPTVQSSNLVITPIAQAPLKIQLSYLESVTVPYDVTTTGGSSSGTRTLTILPGGTASGCLVDSAISSMRLKTSTAGTCIIQVTQAADRNYLSVTSDSQTVNILNFVVNILQLFDNPTGIVINHDVPFVKGPDVCTSNCQPTITNITDTNGNSITTMTVGTPFRIIGTNFTTATGVFFTATIGGSRKSAVPADSFQIDSDTQITVMPPATFIPNAGETVSNIVVRIYVMASGGQNFPNTLITAISL